MTHRLWHRKKKRMALIVGPMVHLQDTTPPITHNAEREKARGNGYLRRLCRQSRFDDALGFLEVMDRRGIPTQSSTYDSLLQLCINKKALAQGKLVHAHMIDNGFNPDISLETKIVIMYAKCGSLVDARRVLDEMREQNVFSRTAMIAAYARHGLGKEALRLFHEMQGTGIQPDEFTFAGVLPAFATRADLKHGKEVHNYVIRSGFQSGMFVASALVDMYVKCGQIEDARQVFDKMSERDVVSWNAMIAGYAQNGDVGSALKLFQKMPGRNVVSWTAMIAGCAQNSHYNEALNLFLQMQSTDVKPNSVTFASVLPACSNLAALDRGKGIHQDIITSGVLCDGIVGNALVDMYAKCGSIKDAGKVFDKMPERNVVSWNAMIQGYASHGCGREALELFEQMQRSGAKPDHVTFVGVLSACCHAGLVDDGWQYFHRMSRDYHITPTVDHYCCMVDLLGRAGQLDRAQDFINNMPVKPNAAVWGSLLGACRIHSNMELGERVAKCLFELDPKNAARYVQLSNIYATAGRWEDVEKVRKLMKDRRVKKNPGCSWIEINKRIYTFLGGDKSHPQHRKIYAELERLSGQMKEAGYVPN